MKKIFYFIASAIVALGAVACQNDIEENINPEGKGVSFYAEVEGMSRITIGEKDEQGYPVIWEEGDKLTVKVVDETTSYGFAYDGEKFTCNDEGVESLLGKKVIIMSLVGTGYIDSTKGKSGIGLYGEMEAFDPNQTVKLSVEGSFLRFSSQYDVTLTLVGGTNPAFFYGYSYKESVTLTAGEDVWVAFSVQTGSGGEATYTLSASIDGEVVKSTEVTLANGKVYLLGTIEKPAVATETVYLVPDWWTTDSPDIYAYYWNADGTDYVKMTANAEGNYECEVPATVTGLIFVRLNPKYDSFGWNDDTTTDRVWNQTGDLTLPEDEKNYYYIEHSCWEVKDYVPTSKTTTIYFWPDSDWAQADATFVAQFGNEKINFTVDENITDYQVYSITYTGDAVSFSILRMSADGKTQWNKKTGLTVPTDNKNCFFSTGWNETGASAGYWDTLPEVKTSTITITAYNYSDWTTAYVYAFGTPTAATAWPGTQLTTVSDKQMTATITVKHFADEQIKFVVNDGVGGTDKQTADSSGYDVASAITFYFTNTLVLDEAPAQPNTKLYLIPSGSWKQNNERYAAYFFGDGDKWVSMTDTDKDGTYEVTIPTDKDFTHVIFCRMNGSQSANNWNNKWDQTADLSLPYYGNNVYTTSSWSWSAKKE